MSDAVVQVTEEHTQQLLISKYLYREGARALDPQLPISGGLAVSLFQDACELAIWTIAKDVDAVLTKQTPFATLWDAVMKGRRNPDGVSLPLRGQMDDVNKARVNFKHNGQLPTISDAIRFASYTEEFLKEAIRLFYGRSFATLSFADLVRHEPARDKLKTAELQRDQQQYQDAIVSAAEAVSYASDGLFSVLPRIDHNLKSVGRGLPREIEQPVHAGFQYVAEQLTRHTDILTTLLLQVPVTDYFRFRVLTPSILRFGDGKAQIVHNRFHPYTGEEAEFCVTYATEFALKTQAVTSHNTPKTLV